jgi:hypothetical protein
MTRGSLPLSHALHENLNRNMSAEGNFKAQLGLLPCLRQMVQSGANNQRGEERGEE